MSDWDAEYEAVRRGETYRSSSVTVASSSTTASRSSGSRPAAPASRPAAGRRTALLDDDEQDVTMRDVTGPDRSQSSTPEPGSPLEQLMRHWMNERHAPDILPAQEVLLGNLLDHIRRQVSFSTCLSPFIGSTIYRRML
jgi:hypothetical protein